MGTLSEKVLIVFILLLPLYFHPSPILISGARVKGRFDRFGSDKNLLNQDSLKNTEAIQYYHHPDGAKITKSSHFEMEYELGRKIVFICTAEGHPRPQITWFKDGIELYAHRWLQVSEWIHNSFKIKSKMEIDPATQMGMIESNEEKRFPRISRTSTIIPDMSFVEIRTLTKLLNLKTPIDRGEYECLANNLYAIDRRRFRTEYIEMD